jgi:hypothetical protein
MAVAAPLGNQPGGAFSQWTEMICYIITIAEKPAFPRKESPMPSLPHHHPHPVVVSASLLRMSALQRLAVAGGVIVVIWAAVFWAMS